MSFFHLQRFSFNCTTKPDDFNASYKFSSLKHVLSRGDFKPLNEGAQTDKHQISKLAVPQTCQTIREWFLDDYNEVHDTNLILLVCFYLIQSSRESFTENILSHETIEPYHKKILFSMRKIQFNWTIILCVTYKWILLTYNQNDCFALF